MPRTDARVAVRAFVVSLGVVVLVSYAVVVSGAPLSVAVESVDGVHMQAEYIEGSSVEMKPEINSVEACDDTMVVKVEDATVSGVRLYAELPRPLDGNDTQVGYELNADEYEAGTLQLVVSRLHADNKTGIGGDLSANSDDGLSFTGEEFRLEGVVTHVYGFGDGSFDFDAPFVRTDFEPEDETLEEYRC